MRQKLTLITLGVKDFQKALAFYEGLGWKKSEQSQEAYALFPLGGIVLGLYPLQERPLQNYFLFYFVNSFFFCIFTL
ncbi:VOC family protein [Alloprevotella sp. OH1205_COT-284]|uniref:VOC family protein n=1 Tax=Alloprevotella sp. OH1205_COT-284 TaxID=2491043 RepID=UPI0026B9531D